VPCSRTHGRVASQLGLSPSALDPGASPFVVKAVVVLAVGAQAGHGGLEEKGVIGRSCWMV
jgi:hypothetical protein